MTERIGAFFDVDGTLLKGNIVRYYAFLRQCQMNRIRRGFFLAGLLARVPYYWIADRISRGRLQARLYRNYRVFSPPELEAATARLFEAELKPKLYPQALECIGAHQARGHVVVLVSGSIRQIVAPVAARVGADGVVCTELEERDGVFSGALKGGSVAGLRKAEAVRRYSREHQIRLAESYAYADSLDDVPMLECVGKAFVVNPEARLRRVALEKGWSLREWGPDRC